jgi:hypothetical protein
MVYVKYGWPGLALAKNLARNLDKGVEMKASRVRIVGSAAGALFADWNGGIAQAAGVRNSVVAHRFRRMVYRRQRHVRSSATSRMTATASSIRSSCRENLAFVNGLAWGNFAGGVKDDLGGGAHSVTVGGIQYTLATTTLAGSGVNKVQNWTLQWTDTNGAAAPNFPATIDLALQWNGGNRDVFYLFDDVELASGPTSGSGVVDIRVMNPRGNSDIGTSHLEVFFTDAIASEPLTGPPGVDVEGNDVAVVPIPEPASILLVGAASRFGLARRRRVA